MTRRKSSSIFGSVAIGKGKRYDDDTMKCPGQDTRYQPINTLSWMDYGLWEKLSPISCSKTFLRLKRRIFQRNKDPGVDQLIFLNGLPAPLLVFASKLGRWNLLHLFERFCKMTLVKKTCLNCAICEADIGI